MTTRILLHLMLALVVFGCQDDDDDSGNLELEPVQTAFECWNNCNGVGFCDERNICRCPEDAVSIAPGYCIQNPDRVIFVSYNTVPDLIDTMILELVDEPFDLVWEEGESAFKPMPGKAYTRNPYAATIGSTGVPITYIWTGPETPRPVDSLWISTIYDEKAGASFGAQSRYMYNEDWRCGQRQFQGKFTDRNTITGNIELFYCRSVVDNPQPDTLVGPIRFPITWHRLER